VSYFLVEKAPGMALKQMPGFMMSYSEYMAREHPDKSELFGEMGTALALCLDQATIFDPGVLTYFGPPDLFHRGWDGTNYVANFVYFYSYRHSSPKAHNDWALYVFTKGGYVTSAGFNHSNSVDRSAFIEYLATENSQQSTGGDTETTRAPQS
jgi:hypothetical protein